MAPQHILGSVEFIIFFFIVMPYSAKIFPLVVYFFYNLSTKFLRLFETQICVGHKKTKTKHELPLPYLL